MGWALRGALVGAAGIGALLALPASTPAIRNEDGAVAAGSIATIESTQLNGAEQWMVIRGRDVNNPVLLFLHGGPGTPESAWLAHYNAALEDDFVVVSWEQRGAGKSIPAGCADPEALTADQMVADVIALTDHLAARFAQERIYLVGHSWGTLLGIRAAQRRPDSYHALVSIAQVSHAAREEAAIHDWVLARARAAGDRRALAELEALAEPAAGRLALEDLSVRLRWVNRYGGGVLHRPDGVRELVKVMLRSRVYSSWEKLRYLHGESLSLAHLYDDMADVDLFTEIPTLDVPIWFVHGRHDHQVPMRVARAYHDALEAPSKTFEVFEDSAHSPLFEEPERFHRLMRDVRAQTQTDPGMRSRSDASAHAARTAS